MKNPNCKVLKTVADLDKSIDQYTKIHENRKKLELQEDGHKEEEFVEEDQMLDNVEEISKQCKLFEYISSGQEENLEEIEKIVKNDKMRFSYDKNQSHHYYVNKKNWDGITPLYVACQNGHLKVIDILMRCDADHLIKCGVSIKKYLIIYEIVNIFIFILYSIIQILQ
jgi:hypothetical protein